MRVATPAQPTTQPGAQSLVAALVSDPQALSALAAALASSGLSDEVHASIDAAVRAHAQSEAGRLLAGVVSTLTGWLIPTAGAIPTKALVYLNGSSVATACMVASYILADLTAGAQVWVEPVNGVRADLVIVGLRAFTGTPGTQALSGGPITTYHSSTVAVDGIATETPATSPRAILMQSWDGAAQHNAFSVGSAFAGLCAVDDNGNVTAPAFHGPADSALTAGSATSATTATTATTANAANALNLDNNAATQFTGHIAASHYATLIAPLASGAMDMSFRTIDSGGVTHDTDTILSTGGINTTNLTSSALPAGVTIGAVQVNLDGTPAKHLLGIQFLNGSASGTFSHGLNNVPSGVFCNTDNGSASTTFGSGSYTSTSVYIYVFSSQAFVAQVMRGG